jgi:hypothetical protein
LTPQDHNKTLGICHLFYGAFHALLLFGFALFLIVVGAIGRGGQVSADSLIVFACLVGVLAFFGVLLAAPSIVAGYGLIKNKNWAKVATIVAGVVDAMNFPFGVALCIYSFWFAFEGAGKRLYDNPRERANYRANEPNAGLGDIPWYRESRIAAQEPSYIPPRPDWRH